MVHDWSAYFRPSDPKRNERAQGQVLRRYQVTSTGRAEVLTTGNIGDWNAVVNECFDALFSRYKNSKLTQHSEYSK